VHTNAGRVICSMPRDYSDAEGELLRLLCRLIDGEPVLPPPVDARSRLLDLARIHRIERLAAWQTAQHGGDLESWFGAGGAPLHDESRVHAVIDAVRARETQSVVEQLAEIDGARPILIKGAALAYTHYAEPWLRARLDTDILIAPASVEAACDALRRLGYARDVSNSGALVFAQAGFERMDRFGITHALDLHWRIANWQAIARVRTHDDIAARAVAVPALGPHARAACGSDAFVLACLHRAAHHRDSGELLWVYDLHLIAARLTASDWQDVAAIAERQAVTALCARGVALARDFFASPVAGPIIDRLAAWESNAAHEPSAVYLSKELRLVDGLMSDLRALRARDGLRLLREHLFPPAAYMRDKYGVQSRAAVLLWYTRRIAAGLPKWLASGTRP
jgi:hypothetical protein